MDFTDTYLDAIDASVTLEINDNADGMHGIINLWSDQHGSVGIALTAKQIHALADSLHTLAAGI